MLCCEKLSSDTKKTLIKFERISNKDFCPLDLLCWERPPCQVAFSADQCTALHLVWVKEGVWGAGQQLCSRAPGRQQTEREWAERSSRATWRLTTPTVVVAEPAGIFSSRSHLWTTLGPLLLRHSTADTRQCKIIRMIRELMIRS